MRATLAAWLMAGPALAAARQPHIRRQDSQQQIYYNTTQSSGLSRSSSTYVPPPAFSYNPDTTVAIASPGPTFTSGASSTSPPLTSQYASTTISATSSSMTASAFLPSGFRYAPSANVSSNDDCGGATLNVLEASLDWWEDTSLYDAIYTISFMHNEHGQETAWTIYGPNTDGDPLSTSTYSCGTDSTTVTWADNTTDVVTSCTYQQVIVAPATTTVDLTAYIQPTIFSGPYLDMPEYITEPPAPTATVPGTNYTYGIDSNVVYFTQYEIMSSNYTKYANGDGVCNTVTTTYNLSAPYAFTYTGPNPEYVDDPMTAITDNLDPALSTALGYNVTVGSFTATPTVIWVVVSAFAAEPLARIFGTPMSAATALDVPTPTLPSGITADTTDSSGYGYSLYTSLAGNTGRVEQSGNLLLVPTASPTTQNIVAQSEASPTSTSASDALEVLTQALGGAIIHGIGGSTGTGLTVAGASATTEVVSAVVIGGQTVQAGGAPITVAGTVISVPSGGASIVVAGSTAFLPGPGSLVNVNGQQVLPTTATVIDIAGQTLLPGGDVATVSGTAISLFRGGGALKVGSSTVMLVTRAITVAGQTVTADASSDFVIAGQTLTPGGTAVIGGTALSLAAGATAVVVNGQTTALGSSTMPAPTPALTIDGQIITAASGATYIVSGQTLEPGRAVTFTGPNGREIVSLDSAGTVMIDVVSGKATTTTLQSATIPVILIGGQTFTAQESGGSTYIISGQTVLAGSTKTITVDGTTYIVSLAAMPTIVAVEALGTSGIPLTTSYETIWAPAVTTTVAVAVNSQSTPTPSKTALLTGSAVSSVMVELLPALIAGYALALATWG